MLAFIQKNGFLAAIVIFSVVLSACGRTAPIKNLESQPVPTNITSADEVKKAIKIAGVSLGWVITENGSNKLKGVLNLRSHQAIISIPYSTKEYSLIYQSSVNLDYDSSEKTIHNNYNGWIQNLNNNIQVQLSGM